METLDLILTSIYNKDSRWQNPLIIVKYFFWIMFDLENIFLLTWQSQLIYYFFKKNYPKKDIKNYYCWDFVVCQSNFIYIIKKKLRIASDKQNKIRILFLFVLKLILAFVIEKYDEVLSHLVFFWGCPKRRRLATKMEDVEFTKASISKTSSDYSTCSNNEWRRDRRWRARTVGDESLRIWCMFVVAAVDNFLLSFSQINSFLLVPIMRSVSFTEGDVSYL